MISDKGRSLNVGQHKLPDCSVEVGDTDTYASSSEAYNVSICSVGAE